jgi:carbamoyltransferase
MLIAGVSVAETRTGQPLKDGAACLVQDGRVVVAVAEERLTRRKHAGGFERALPYCLAAIGATAADIDIVAVSTCAEPPLKPGADLGLDVAADVIRSVPSHHLSHAYAAFWPSPFESAAIMVMDNEGNVLDPSDPGQIERQSYYVGHGNEIAPLLEADDQLRSGELGVGQVYRHFTYFLGWPSYVYAGHTMGLAPYGRPWAIQDVPVFDLEDGCIRARVEDGGGDPPRGIESWAVAAGVEIGPRRGPDEPLTPRHADIAAHAQGELERALIHKAARLHELTKSPNLCLAGGVALNCVANRKLLDCTPFERLYVSPAPGDTGQCIGNAFFAWREATQAERPREALTPYLGRAYTDVEIRSALDVVDDIAFAHSDDPAREAAKMLAAGYVLGWFQGRSELGPRALGARSILADPRPVAMRDYINLVIKRRAAFRPFGPSMPADQADQFCDLPQVSPYMELTGHIDPGMRRLLPAVTHVDGSSRPHTVEAEDNPLFHRLLTEFATLTDLPVVLNTSFNVDGEPIVESPADALDCLLKSKLDAVVLGPYIARRRGDDGEPGFRAWHPR